MAEVQSNYQNMPPTGTSHRVTISPHPPSAGRRNSPGSSHGRRLGTPKTPEERFSPAPDYMRPMCQSAQRRWKRHQEQAMMDTLVDKWTVHKNANHRSRDEAKRLARKIPMEILAKEWLNIEGATVETRAFLVDKVLPTLILGVEKLLTEVDKKDLSEKLEPDNNFNPINYLAQYLMRNNPRYSNFCEASPYIRGLREITDALKDQLFEFEDNRLAKIKAEAKRKREEREKAEQLRLGERQRREEALRMQFLEWNVGEDGRIELAVLQNALRSFMEIAELYPEDLRLGAEYSQPIEPTDLSGKTLIQREFSSYVNQFIEEMPSAVFDHFLSHLSKCARTYRMSAGKEIRRGVLTDLFSTCDHSGIGVLDRHRILNLFEMFWDKLSADVKAAWRNPRQWPVVEVEETSLSDSEDEADAREHVATDEKEVTADGGDEKEVTADGGDEKEVTADAGDEKEVTADAGDEKEVTADTGEAQEEKPDNTDESKEPEKQRKNSTGSVKEGKEDSNIEDKDKTKESEEELNKKETETADDNAAGKATPEADGNKPPQEGAEASQPEPQDAAEKAEASEGATTKEKVEENREESMDAKKKAEEKDESSAEKKDEEKLDKEGDEEKMADKTDEEQPKPDEPSEEKSSDAVEKDEGGQAQEGATGAEGQATEPSGGDMEKPAQEVTEKEKASSQLPEKESDETAQEAGIADDATEDAAATSHDEVGDLALLPGATTDKPPLTQQSKVSFAEGTTFEREKTNMTSTSQTRSQSQASAFDESTLNVSQFVQVTESFLGDDPTVQSFHQLVDFIKDGYVETEEEKMERLMKVKQEERLVKRRQLLNNLFEMWDNDGSGFIDLDEVETVMKKYKDGQEEEAINAAKKSLRRKNRHHDQRLSKREFREFIYKVAEHMPGEEAFDMFVDFLVSSVEKSYTERMRGEARKKWLKQIITAAETGGASMEPVYKAVFQSLYKDAETHGNGKKISASIAMLERNAVAPSRGDTLLRYMACTPDDAIYILGKCLYQDMKGISFASIESGKPIHVPRVSNHGNIFFWNSDRPQDEREGSYIVVPLKDKTKRVFGLLGIDTMNDPQPRTIFITHEIQFFQGIAKAFSIAYHHVDVRRKTMRIAESAVSWIHRRCFNISEITVYMVEPEVKSNDFVLRKMMATDQRGNAVTLSNPPRLERKDNLFRDYLFRCVDNSESVTADAYGERHLSFPLRDLEGKAIVVVDISIGSLKSLPKSEQKEVMRMLKLMQVAYRKITQEAVQQEEDSQEQAEAETEEENKIDTLFDRLMLMELRENVMKLDARAYAELKSYKEPPKIIHLVLKAVLSVIYPEHAESGALENWVQCKNLLNMELSNKIVAFDPTSKIDDRIPLAKVNEYLNEVPHGAVDKHGSIPTKHLYSWVFVCVSLIEHTRKMDEEKRRQNVGAESEETPEEGGAAEEETARDEADEAADEAEQQQEEGEEAQRTEEPALQQQTQ